MSRPTDQPLTGGKIWGRHAGVVGGLRQEVRVGGRCRRSATEGGGESGLQAPCPGSGAVAVAVVSWSGAPVVEDHVMEVLVEVGRPDGPMPGAQSPRQP